MADQIYIGNFAKGLTTNRLPFVIDNDAFPTVYNMYLWRGRAKRKRGTEFLGQLAIQTQLVASAPSSWQFTGPSLSGGAVNLFSSLSITSKGGIKPGSVSLVVGANTYTDQNGTGVLTGSPSGTGTINYSTSAITISGGGSSQVTGTFSYFPGLPVMGLEDYLVSTTAGQVPSPYPLLIAFDTVKAYQFNQTTSAFYNISYYKTTNIPVSWAGQNYQQFWSTNYSGAFWATNNNPGFHFVTATYSSGSTTTSVTFNFKSGGVNFTSLIVGDKLFFNEWSSSNINGVTGAVSDISGAASGNYVVTFVSAATVTGTGIAQLLTNSISGQDGIRWYDGDPTNSTGLPTTTSTGWVNFAPPLTSTTVSINNLPAALYYLVGAISIVQFKDRLLFFSPWIKTSTGSAIQLEDSVIWSWNGTPYYSTVFPSGQTSDSTAYYVDVTGKGGWLSAGTEQSITTVTSNQDVLIVGFTGTQTRFVYTGNDFSPFLFFQINSELGSAATFSGINLDAGTITVGTYGILMTSQQSCQRIDLEIPDYVFDIQNNNNGMMRVNGARDFFREWVYFSYPMSTSTYVFPTQTFLFNYRDNTWAILYENFTAHGSFRRTSNRTWGGTSQTWGSFNETWGSGVSTAQFPNVVGGNPQGYVLIKGIGTGESISGTIEALAATSGNDYTTITSTNHCVRVADYLLITGIIGTASYLNNQIGRVNTIVDNNNFVLDVIWVVGSTYLGLGKYSRLSQPQIQTKQFNVYWDQGRQVRLCAQKYLMDRTTAGEVTLQIFLSQNPSVEFNNPLINTDNLQYSQTLYTCQESTNLGLTEPNQNLQTLVEDGFQIWHRVNTSLIGESVQIGITLNDEQMRDLTLAQSEIALQGIQLTVTAGPLLS